MEENKEKEISVSAEEKTEQTKEIKNEKKSKMKCNLTNGQKTMVAIVVLAVLVGASYVYTLRKSNIGTEGAKAAVEKFIKENTPPEAQVKVKEVVKEGDLYKVTISDGKQDFPTYITKDGKKLFLQTVDLNGEKKDQPKQAAAPEQKEIPKTDKPTVDLYVMSFCPFGNKAEDTLKPVYDLLKNKVEFNFHYIVSTQGDAIQSLHGEKEVVQNEREACVLKQYGKDKWMNFVTYVNKNCGSDGACWEAGAKTLGINVANVSSCVTSQGVALMKENEKASSSANATASPTMMINGVQFNNVGKFGNSELYKKAICDSFNTAPEQCQKALSSQTATQAGGSCN